MSFARLARRMKTMRQHDRWSRAELEAHQQREVQRQRAYAYAHSAFYREHHRGLFEAPLAELPPLSKATLMAHYEEVVTDSAIRLAEVREHLHTIQGDQLFRGRYRLTATSGSTGQPGLFLYDPEEWLWILCSFGRTEELSGWHVDLHRRTKMAGVGSTVPYHMSCRIAASLRTWWTPELRVDLTKPVSAVAEALDGWQPELMATYASMAHKLAAEQLAGRLHISPRRIYTGAEPLFPEWRVQIEAAWGPCLFDTYAATETGAIAGDCEEHGGLHLLEDFFLAEVVDANNQPVPDGEIGDKLLVTMFNRRTQPLIRYEMSDCIRLSPEPCRCGRPSRLIESIQGRIEDLVPVPGANGGLIGIRPVGINSVMVGVPVAAWQLQATDGALKLLLAGLPEGYDEQSIVRDLNEAFRKQGGTDTPVAIEHVDHIPLGLTGKTVPIVVKTTQAVDLAPA